MKLSQSAKLRLVKQARKLVDRLTERLVSCDISEYHNVHLKLKDAQSDLAVLAALMPTNPRKAR